MKLRVAGLVVLSSMSCIDLTSLVDAGLATNATLSAADAGVPPLVYTGNRTQSPIDGLLGEHLGKIAARGTGRASVFSKVGDSISSNVSGVGGGDFLNCLDGPIEGAVSWEINVRLGDYAALAPTIEFFKGTKLGPDDSWTRVSLATKASTTAEWAITGTPSPLEQEMSAVDPRYAVVMFGSNDINSVTSAASLPDAVERYEKNMRTLTDQLIGRGVIPLLTTMPTDVSFLRYVPVYSGVVRAIAQGRQVPLIDYTRELFALGAPYGLATDGRHPTCEAYNTCCWFDGQSLSRHGYNVRNLITLQALDRMHQVLDLGVHALEPSAPRLQGDGSIGTPFVITSVPWGELRSIESAPFKLEGTLSCAGAPPVSGPQILYRLVLSRATSLRIMALGVKGQAVSLLSSPSLSSCLRSGQRLISASLEAGTYYVSVNALSAHTGGEYNLSITECVPGDPDC